MRLSQYRKIGIYIYLQLWYYKWWVKWNLVDKIWSIDTTTGSGTANLSILSAEELAALVHGSGTFNTIGKIEEKIWRLRMKLNRR